MTTKRSSATAGGFPNRSLRLIEVGILVVALGLGIRLFQIQVVRHDEFLKLASKQWEKNIHLPALRGNLFDRRGAPLAVSSQHYRVTCDPSQWQKLDSETYSELVGELAGILGLRERKLRGMLRGKGHFATLHEGIALGLGERELLEGTGLVSMESQARRLYPLGTVGAPLIGQINSDGCGISGFEAGLQDFLAGTPGLAKVQKDDLGRQLISSRNHIVAEPLQGDDVTLTLDHKVQAIADVELARGACAANASSGAVVVMEPSTGEIIALSSWPAPTARDGSYRAEEWKLLPVQAIYEPGSTLKAITSIALLEKGGIDMTTQVDAEDGRALIDGFRIRDDRPHYGLLSFREAFKVSSNICFAKFSSRVTDQELFSTLQAAGFGNRYGIALPGEERGQLRKPGDWSGRSRMTLSFGHEISATPLQMTAAFSAIANDGRLMKPYILRSRRDRVSGEVQEWGPTPMRRICRSDTAERIRELMALVVAEGTGTKAAVAGLSVGGKTGTAQKFDAEGLKSTYLASFIGMVPIEAPSLVIGVFLDEPDAAHCHGGSGAAPIFARIIEGIAVSTAYLRPAGEAVQMWAGDVGGPVAPTFLDLNSESAAALALSEDITITFKGRGSRVISQSPAPGCDLRSDQTIELALGDPGSRAESVPHLIGLSLREARRQALQRGYAIAPRGSGFVVSQGEPSPRDSGAIPVELEPSGMRRGS